MHLFQFYKCFSQAYTFCVFLRSFLAAVFGIPNQTKPIQREKKIERESFLIHIGWDRTLNSFNKSEQRQTIEWGFVNRAKGMLENHRPLCFMLFFIFIFCDNHEWFVIFTHRCMCVSFLLFSHVRTEVFFFVKDNMFLFSFLFFFKYSKNLRLI